MWDGFAADIEAWVVAYQFGVVVGGELVRIPPSR
jgi:hypothetical protein